MRGSKHGLTSSLRHALISLSLVGAFAIQPVAATAQQPSARDSFSFVVLGHLRGGVEGGYNYLVDELVEQVRQLRPDLVFLTGDLIWGDYHLQQVRRDTIISEWARLDSALSRIGTPVYRVPGNHDINDPVTRDVYFQRYGTLPQVVDYKSTRFILLNSSFVPKGDSLPPRRRRFIGGMQLDSAQINFLQSALAAADTSQNTFVFLHHVLWWDDQAEWWRNVHPLLVGKARAVFAGDYGPMKFSHVTRDSIDYIQSSIEDFPALRLLQRRIESRLLYQQFDNFLHVTVAGPRVTVEVKTLGPITGKKFTPQRWRAINSYSPPVSERLRTMVGTPKRIAMAAAVLAAAFLSGVGVTVFWLRRRSGFASRRE